MKSKECRILIIVSLALLAAMWHVMQVAGAGEQPAEAMAQLKNTVKDRDVLANLEGVHVVVEEFGPRAEEYGFTARVFQTEVELRLRQHGVSVLSFEEFRRAEVGVYLYVNVNLVINEEFRFAAVHTQVELREDTLLLRSPTTCVYAATWNKGRVMLCGLNKLSETRQDVRDLVDMFINDYYSANPTKSAAASSPATKVPQKGLITGIASNTDVPSAVINNRIVPEGDAIDGVTVVEIHTDRVVLEKEEKQAIVRWTQKIGEAPKAHWE